MLDCEIGLAGPDPDVAAHIPAVGIARVERERTVDQPDHGTDVLSEASQHKCGVGEDARVALPHLERLPSEVAGLATACLRVFGPALNDEPRVAVCRPGQRRAVMPIDRDRLPEQSQSLENPLFRYRKEYRNRAQ